MSEEMQVKEEIFGQLKEIFDEMSIDGTNSITKDEFEKHLSDERVMSYFNSLKLDVSDARTLFSLLDYDLSGDVGIDEFVSGCYKLQGGSRKLDTAIMQQEIKWVKEFLIAESKKSHVPTS